MITLLFKLNVTLAGDPTDNLIMNKSLLGLVK